ncbi:MAG TPA: YgiT-type zinc finger protein [Anaerolineales bacterium]|nr:YgiT-type zinc finger protein [Anaerolineales bacterium]
MTGTASAKPEQTYPCPECQVGALRPAHVSYFSSVSGRPVAVPDFPAWVCDVCGRREYDQAALAELRAMLESDRLGRRLPRRARRRPTFSRTRTPAGPRKRT